MKLRLLFIISILLSVFEMQAQIPIYVDKAATGTNVGTSWANAYTSLEDAILAYSVGKEIWVAAETYKPYLPARNQTFLMRNGIKIYGGFNGTETLLSQRNPKLNITTLSGDVSGNDNATIHSAEATRQDNLYHVISVRGNVQNVIIDGFTISGGNANGATLTSGAAASQYYHTRGGAIYINPYANGDNPTVFVTNCIFEKNSGSDVSTVTSYYASGVFSLSYTANFDLCIFRNNFSEMNAQILYGGYGPYFWFATGKITNCLFNNNTSTLGVSCLYLSASATGGTSNGLNIDIINTTFASNVGASGCVIKADNAHTVRFKNSIIYNNGSLTPFSIVGTVFPVLQNTISQNGQLGGWSTNPLLSATFELQAGSLAIDSGSNVHLPVGTTTDLFGNNRIYNTTVDLGCYEYGSALGRNNFSSFSDFSVYPNPSNGIINIESKEDIETIDILSLEGRKVKSCNETKIDISDLSNGIYLMQIKTIDGKFGTKKIIKN